MNIREAQNYIEELSALGSKPGLDRIKTLCRLLGNPEQKLKFIHVAGTNGKGSTCAYISTVLQMAGIKTGVFTSPAVFEYRERYRINGRNVSQAVLCRNLDIVRECAISMKDMPCGEPTLFEVETALCFMIFLEAGCEIVVLECGMGGELDSTNVIGTPLVSVITSISLDHMAFLGKNLESIAKQKAGIIKNKSHVVTFEQQPEVMSVIKAKCSLEKADITILNKSDIKNIKYGLRVSSFDIGKHKGIKIGLSGIHQVINAGIALLCIEALKKEHIKISDDVIIKGLSQTCWPGRFETISKKPTVIIDGAHNEDAAKCLSDTLEYFYHNEEENKKIIYIMGVLADKNYEEICRIMAPHAAHVITVTPPNNPRALSAQELAQTMSKYNSMVTCAGSVTEALEIAYLIADSDSIILAFGSLSYLGELKKQVELKAVNLRKKETRI